MGKVGLVLVLLIAIGSLVQAVLGMLCRTGRQVPFVLWLLCPMGVFALGGWLAAVPSGIAMLAAVDPEFGRRAATAAWISAVALDPVRLTFAGAAHLLVLGSVAAALGRTRADEPVDPSSVVAESASLLALGALAGAGALQAHALMGWFGERVGPMESGPALLGVLMLPPQPLLVVAALAALVAIGGVATRRPVARLPELASLGGAFVVASLACCCGGTPGHLATSYGARMYMDSPMGEVLEYHPLFGRVPASPESRPLPEGTWVSTMHGKTLVDGQPPGPETEAAPPLLVLANPSEPWSQVHRALALGPQPPEDFWLVTVDELEPHGIHLRIGKAEPPAVVLRLEGRDTSMAVRALPRAKEAQKVVLAVDANWLVEDVVSWIDALRRPDGTLPELLVTGPPPTEAEPPPD